ncbi:peroxidase family protein [Jiella mangrovi]|uniref:Peroxidase n=1 Tax=Jiella mangrovi TaxID=2821407 RepID=A0ABS4BE68_9HYPH|nr:peroxidase family protein [Jiella mangrovi]MBP0614255.1 hypothetical protein [Jiella mangrovi]
MLFFMHHGRGSRSERSERETWDSGAHRCRRKDATADCDPDGNPFGYLFDAEDTPTHTASQIKQLANEITANAVEPAERDSNLPPVFTYLSQFIDHDLTANTDRDTSLSEIGPEDADLTPLPRDKVLCFLGNLRKGSLGLDSVYGDGPELSLTPEQQEVVQKLQSAMRWMSGPFVGKLRLARPGSKSHQGAVDIPLPADDGIQAADLLRLGNIIGELISADDLRKLPNEMAKIFFVDETLNEPQKARAIIGDMRNDENLIVAQLQTAFIRLHNVIVDWLRSQGMAEDDLFSEARELVRYHYQWLVLNVFLPTICNKHIVQRAINNAAPLYTQFLKQFDGVSHASMPMPLEFSVAAYRYGHSMIRESYDYNRNFGLEANAAPELTFREAFQFTGGGGLNGVNDGNLPADLLIEWVRYVMPIASQPQPSGKTPRRAARKIDSHLNFELNNMVNEENVGVFQRLAERNLRRAQRLNVGTGQQLFKALGSSAYSDLIEAVDTSEIMPPFDNQTPLWLYVLKEAEKKGGDRLGSVGSAIVADTLVGLVINDPKSYWQVKGSQWHPRDGAKPNGFELSSLENLFCATGQI